MTFTFSPHGCLDYGLSHSLGSRPLFVFPSIRPLPVTCPSPCEYTKLIIVSFPRFRYVPNPSPSVFRTTKNNHNILQGVAAPTLRLNQEQKDGFDAWIRKNGLRWTAEGGPLA